MSQLNEVTEKEKLLYKKCCNYACECKSDALRKILGDVANESRIRLDVSSEELKND